MVGGRYTVPSDRRDGDGDNVLFYCAAVILVSGGICTIAAALGCSNGLLSFFAPELSWLLLAPSVLIVLLGAAALCSSWRLASKLFRAQLGLFLLILSVVLAGLGAWMIFSTKATAIWIADGCTGYVSTGVWSLGGRIAKQLEKAHEQYTLLHGGWMRCRMLHPLVYDLANCGIRAKCANGKLARDLPMYDWVRQLQLKLRCGGFCREDVPIFGVENMGDTLVKRTSCAMQASHSVEFLGYLLGGIAFAVSAATICVAYALFCASRRSRHDFQEIRRDDEYDTIRGYDSESE